MINTPNQNGNVAALGKYPRSFWLAVFGLAVGALHYGLACLIWLVVIVLIGIDSENVQYYLRDAFPALVFFCLFLAASLIARRKPRVVRPMAVTLCLATLIHFGVDERFHHFTLQMMTDRGCIHQSPTWWWYDHKCGRFFRGS